MGVKHQVTFLPTNTMDWRTVALAKLLRSSGCVYFIVLSELLVCTKDRVKLSFTIVRICMYYVVILCRRYKSPTTQTFHPLVPAEAAPKPGRSKQHKLLQEHTRAQVKSNWLWFYAVNRQISMSTHKQYSFCILHSKSERGSAKTAPCCMVCWWRASSVLRWSTRSLISDNSDFSPSSSCRSCSKAWPTRTT